VAETSAGVYVVSGYPVAIQVIESKKLPFEENLWLRGLSSLNGCVRTVPRILLRRVWPP
jgi:hypothetical protein